MKYTVQMVSKDERGEFVTGAVIPVVDPAGTFPAPAPLFDSMEAAETHAQTAVPAFVVAEAARLEGTPQGAYSEHRGLKEYHGFIRRAAAGIAHEAEMAAEAVSGVFKGGE